MNINSLHLYIYILIFLITVTKSKADSFEYSRKKKNINRRSTLQQQQSPQSQLSVWEKKKLLYKNSEGCKEPHIAIFIHAAVGIFKKKRFPNETWGFGAEILDEMLTTTLNHGLMGKAKGIYITSLGEEADTKKVEESISRLRKNETVKADIQLLIRGKDLYVAEYPTLHAIQLYAQQSHNDTLILYMHTKGMRNNGKRAADWRRYMEYFVAERWDICTDALSHRNYETCGVLKTDHEYMGNFWWARAGWIKTRKKLDTMEWNMEQRMFAEDWLLQGVSSDEEQSHHYCVHSIDHNMYDCPTPRHLYEIKSSTFFWPHAHCPTHLEKRKKHLHHDPDRPNLLCHQ